jgi:hypothetical protein
MAGLLRILRNPLSDRRKERENIIQSAAKDIGGIYHGE